MRGLFGVRLRRPVLIISACLALFLGILLACFFDAPGAWWLWISALAVLLLWRLHNVSLLICLVVLCLGLGWWRGSVFMQRLSVNQGLYLRKVVLVGVAAEDGVYAERSQMAFSLSNAQVLSPYKAELLSGVSIKGFGVPAIYRGDVVQVSGELYPSRGNNLSSMSFAEVRILKSQPSLLDSFRRKLAAGLQSALPEPAASFGLGLLIGQRNTLPADVSDQLRAVGLTHIIAVSGYNLTIIVEAVRRLLAKRSKFQATVGCVFLIFTFLAITGSSPPIVRAAVISLLGLAAWHYGRKIKPLVLLLLSAAITALANPLYLWGNVSWYLSFLAFFGVLVLAPLVTGRYFIKKPGLLKSIAIESACAGVMTAPYILYVFGQISLLALVANILVVALVLLAMLLSLGAGLAGMLLPSFAGWLAWPARWLLTYMLDVAGILARVPHGFVQQIEFRLWEMLAAYGLLAIFCLVLYSFKNDSSHTESGV